MLFADTVRIVAFAVGGVLGLYGLWLMLFGLWPDRVLACAQRLDGGIWRYFFLGILPMIPIGLLAGALGQGAVIIVLPLLVGQCGVAGIALHVGRRLAAGTTGAPALCKGGQALALAILFPFVGWVGILLFLTTIGFGLWMAGLRRPKPEGGSEPPAIPESATT